MCSAPVAVTTRLRVSSCMNLTVCARPVTGTSAHRLCPLCCLLLTWSWRSPLQPVPTEQNTLYMLITDSVVL
ncbi:hypothetical protein PHYPO_G00159620 [Pangasianodon hypophthalmus]|uniref:Uncharacterized protein n=1 Tax=Pangasianodon hypophthalmus TaxID=310915 RepID=A0A5N5JUP1_PANHP|nr:hypothetical protein PHYPO_G00159620 [Pangasianodon hypophthalmus]